MSAKEGVRKSVRACERTKSEERRAKSEERRAKSEERRAKSEEGRTPSEFVPTYPVAVDDSYPAGIARVWRGFAVVGRFEGA
jgi:hypothetical protein